MNAVCHVCSQCVMSNQARASFAGVVLDPLSTTGSPVASDPLDERLLTPTPSRAALPPLVVADGHRRPSTSPQPQFTVESTEMDQAAPSDDATAPVADSAKSFLTAKPTGIEAVAANASDAFESAKDDVAAVSAVVVPLVKPLGTFVMDQSEFLKELAGGAAQFLKRIGEKFPFAAPVFETLSVMYDLYKVREPSGVGSQNPNSAVTHVDLMRFAAFPADGGSAQSPFERFHVSD